MNRGDSYNLENFEKLLMFFYVLKNIPIDKDEQIKRFRQITGFSESETRQSLDTLILEGFIDDAV